MLKNNIVKVLACCILVILVLICEFCYRYKNNNNIKTDEINIVFITDQAYFDYTRVAIKSAIENKSIDSKYNINVICVDIPQVWIKELIKESKENVKIIPVETNLKKLENIGNYHVINHVSRADLFKFLLPEIFPNLDKILYIDSDTIILKDLSELYNTNLSRYPLGAVRRFDQLPEWNIHKIFNFRYAKQDFKNGAYNCGVMLYNLDYWRKHNVSQKLINSKNETIDITLMTQSHFNIVIPINKVYLLSPIYNAYIRWLPESFKKNSFKKIYKPWLKDMESIDDIYNNAVILHFNGSKKPWLHPNSKKADIWWLYAKKINLKIQK